MLHLSNFQYVFYGFTSLNLFLDASFTFRNKIGVEGGHLLREVFVVRSSVVPFLKNNINR